MAIGTLAAVGLGVSAVGGVLSAKSANKASKRAAQVSTDNNATNNALQRDVYNQNKAILSPFVNRGNAAGDTINALLGLGGGQQNQGQQGLPQQQPQVNALYNGGYPDAGSFQQAGGNPYGGPAPQFGGQPQAGSPLTQQQSADNAFDIYRGSSGYQFRLGEGQNALNSGYAGSGVLQSGDAIRSALEYNQNFASNEFGNFLGYLGNQQGVGLSAGSAVAGVGQNYANNVTASNTQNAANQANALTSRQNPFANFAGTVGGGLFGYGTRKL